MEDVYKAEIEKLEELLFHEKSKLTKYQVNKAKIQVGAVIKDTDIDLTLVVTGLNNGSKDFEAKDNETGTSREYFYLGDNWKLLSESELSDYRALVSGCYTVYPDGKTSVEIKSILTDSPIPDNFGGVFSPVSDHLDMNSTQSKTFLVGVLAYLSVSPFSGSSIEEIEYVVCDFNEDFTVSDFMQLDTQSR